jgi:hypothetical protein
MLEEPIGAFGPKQSFVHVQMQATCAPLWQTVIGDPRAVGIASQPKELLVDLARRQRPPT